ncbi:MAG TPA: hypothetical protein VFQ44_16455 [Streptosporangiaceae bacterium]|nr:hypothetical protein [Streptosporangiaceae bacterium]
MTTWGAFLAWVFIVPPADVGRGTPFPPAQRGRFAAATGERGPVTGAERRGLRRSGAEVPAGERRFASLTRSGTRDEIRSFRERPRAAHDYSADISDKVQRGGKRCATGKPSSALSLLD